MEVEAAEVEVDGFGVIEGVAEVEEDNFAFFAMEYQSLFAEEGRLVLELDEVEGGFEFATLIKVKS